MPTASEIGFAYTSGKPVITDLSLTIRPGKEVGLFGLSGAGKTTLVSLLRPSSIDLSVGKGFDK
ncbi:ABC transporter family protein [Rhizobium sp. PP-CC-3G-465]|nr:ABC transporter family protein [Rhizobium sp. PP-CC-3G-465]